jgi:hypothetical protein
MFNLVGGFARNWLEGSADLCLKFVPLVIEAVVFGVQLG